jgi:hypothetical protein
MSDPVVVPPPPAKKGMSTGAKIAVGCLIALVLCVGGCFVMTAIGLKWAGGKVKDFAEKAEKDPDYGVYKLALTAFQANPDYEVVSSDDSAKSITVREKKSGKKVTFTLSDIKSGRLSIESEGEKVNVDVDQSGTNGGSMTISSEKGKMTFGATDMSALPSWVIAYPGARTDGVSTLESNGEKSGTFTIHTSDSAEQVLAFYAQKLEGSGFEVEKTNVSGTHAAGGSVTGTAGNRSLSVIVSNQEGETQGLVAFTEKP